jgi:hypothetical protein
MRKKWNAILTTESGSVFQIRIRVLLLKWIRIRIHNLFTAMVTWRKRYKNPGLSTTILQYGGSGGAADKAVLNQKKNERKRTKKVSFSLMSPLLIMPVLFAPIKKNSTRESPFKFCFPRCLSTISTVYMFSCFHVSYCSLSNLFAIYASTEQEK